MNTYLVTGGAGFIGGNFVLKLLRETDARVINLDALTYAGNLDTLSSVRDEPRHVFVKGDIDDRTLVARLFHEHDPDTVINFAAETHVDRSIAGPTLFARTNIMGTLTLLQEARGHWKELPDQKKKIFRFLHVSTDEVYGSLGETGAFTETTAYAPNSPYAASKAGADHLVRAFFHTYGLPVLTTNCSNNYGPYQFPEKLMPLMLAKGLAGEPMPVYGDGMNVRDWLYVEDHCDAVLTVAEKGTPGEVYNIGGNCEKTNIEVVKTLCSILDEQQPDGAPHEKLIAFVKDRPGHDRRYAIDASKIKRDLGWEPKETFETGIRKTARWYLDNQDWVQRVLDGSYRLERLGALDV